MKHSSFRRWEDKERLGKETEQEKVKNLEVDQVSYVKGKIYFNKEGRVRAKN